MLVLRPPAELITPNMDNAKSVLECRNCGSIRVLSTPQGIIAPFFAKRVHDIELMTLGELINLKLNKYPSLFFKPVVNAGFELLSITGIGKRLSNFRSPIKTNIRVCRDCTFIGPDSSYSHAQLLKLYADYRSDSYNDERSLFEPKYKKIQSLVGKSEIEVNNRLDNVDNLIREYVELESIKKVLDWGGGEGRFVPKELRKKNVFVLDVSTESLSDKNFIRIERPAINEKFDFIQICHVLEHVSSPRDFLMNALSFLNSGGYLYLEVPQDRNEEDIQKIIKENPSLCHIIHEHLNLFTTRSLEALAHSFNLKKLMVGAKQIDSGWMEARVVSGLFMKM